jgi:ATP-dependent helicase HepA
VGFEMVPKGGTARWYLEFGGESTVEALYGVPAGSRWLGTFDREEAVRRESLDFFAAGHPLVEGVLAELRDGTRGRLALLEIADTMPGTGVLVVTKDGPEFRLAAFDLDGGSRPDWVDAIEDDRDLDEVPASAWDEPEWSDRVRALLALLPIDGDIVALAGVRSGPSGS